MNRRDGAEPTPSPFPGRKGARWGAIGAAAAIAVIAGAVDNSGGSGSAAAARAEAAQVRAIASVLDNAPAPVRAVYRQAQDRPLWFDGAGPRPVARAVLARIRAAEADGLDPGPYAPDRLEALMTAAMSGDAAAIARADIALTTAAARFAADLRRPRPGAELAFQDIAFRQAAAAPPPPDGDALATAAMRMNPLYEALRQELAEHRRRRGGLTPVAGADRHEQLLRANLERARALPPPPGRRFIFVNSATATLWLYEDGRPKASMPVIVGKPSQPTPALAGLLRYAVYNPYWNIPEDIVRDSVAPKVLRQGLGYFRAQRFEALSDWSDRAHILPPEAIDWTAVAAGRTPLRVRQLPGGANAMGRVKFMLPNELGIYLHDTPDKHLFAAPSRRFSAGCVRLSDADMLQDWLFGESFAPPATGTERRVYLAEPVAVFIAYLTAAPTPDGPAFSPDPYRLDEGLIAQLEQGRELAAG